MTETKEDEVKKSELLSRISELLLSKELADVTFAVSNSEPNPVVCARVG
jgi:hypothetical protein